MAGSPNQLADLAKQEQVDIPNPVMASGGDLTGL